MTRQDYFIRKTKLGCVLKSSKTAPSNPLFSYMVTEEEMDELIRTGVNPTFKIRVTFKSGEVYELMFYHKLKSGVKHSAIEKWAIKGLAKIIYHPENIISARFIMG